MSPLASQSHKQNTLSKAAAFGFIWLLSDFSVCARPSVWGDMVWDTFQRELVRYAPLTLDSCRHCQPCSGGRRRGRWPALAQGEAGPRAACAHYGDALTPPRRSRPSRAGAGSGNDGWCRGFPRGCGFLGWGSPSSGAVHIASPREREGHLS